MKKLLLAFMMLFSVTSTFSQEESTNITVSGDVISKSKYTLWVIECDETWNDVKSHCVPYSKGIFGSKNYFEISGLSNNRYMFKFIGDDFYKEILFNFTNVDVNLDLPLIIYPSNSTERVYIEWDSFDKDIVITELN